MLYALHGAFTIYAQGACWFCECCLPRWDVCENATSCGSYGPVSSISECSRVCDQVGRKYCGEMPCPDDECQVDSDCGPGCRCLYDPGGNYCFCSGNGGGGGGGNNPPTCTINGPTSITYDAKRYWDATKTLRTQNPTEHRLSLTLSDPDGDAVSVTNVTVDRNCLTSRRAGNDVYVTPQGQVTGVTPVLTGTNSCDVQVDSEQ